MKLHVCALTYKRPDGLRRLLDGFRALELDESWQLRFVIVDNDPGASGRDLVEEENAQSESTAQFHYVHQPIQGIARSRNAALDASKDADLIAFIDDDEVPHPDWLTRLVAAIDLYEADVVGGPVIPVIEGDAPAYIRDGGFFDRRRYPSGTRLGHVFTNNVLFRGEKQRSLGVRFDERPRFAELRVGEDRLFFQALRMGGARTCWCDEALVREFIPQDRAEAGWLAERMRKIGLATAAVELELSPKLKTRALILMKAIVWWLLGLWKTLVGLGRPLASLHGARARLYAAGLLQGLRRS